MRDLVLTLKSVKLMTLCHAQGIDGYDDLMKLSVADSLYVSAQKPGRP